MPLPQFANCFAFYCLNKLTMDSPIQNWRLLVVGVRGLRWEVTRSRGLGGVGLLRGGAAWTFLTGH